MTNIYQGKIFVHFSELLLLKYNENAIFFFKITQNEVKAPFFLEKSPFRCVTFGGFPYFLNETLDKVYSNQLRSCNPTYQKDT